MENNVETLPRMPVTGESALERLARAAPLPGTAGAAYVARRGVSVEVADRAGLRYDPDFGGRPAVVAAMVDPAGVRAVHGRYLEVPGRADKMLTVGVVGGVVPVGEGWAADPLIIVEGLFDALSIACCGRSAVSTIGRDAPFLREATAGRAVYVAFDAGRAGDRAAAELAARLDRARVRRLRPPERCQDWNTALRKRGAGEVGRWLDRNGAKCT